MTTDSPIQSQRLASAQAAVLGAMLIDADCIADVLADTTEKMFVSGQYRTVYSCIRQLFQAAQPVDPVTVGAALKEVTGQDYGEMLVQLMDGLTQMTGAELQLSEARTQIESGLKQIQEAYKKVAEQTDLGGILSISTISGLGRPNFSS